MAVGDENPIAPDDDCGRQDGRPQDADLLAAALAIMAEEGLGGLTLRPLARRLGYPIATFARQVGSKDELLDHLIALAARADRDDLEPWLQLVQSMETLPLEAVIEITEEVLRMRCGAGRSRSHFKCEVVQAAATNPRLRPAIAEWIAVDRQLWQSMADRAEEKPQTLDMVAALEAFAVDDAARALIIDEFDAYRWMRREGIRRLWHGLFTGKPSVPSVLYMRALSDQPSPNGVPFWSAKTLTTTRDQNFGAIIADLILDIGTDSVTHREVARRAGMPHSSVAYHYPMQDDLVELGMNAIVEMVRSESLAAMNSKELPLIAGQLAYASFAIALAAARRPNLRPIAREMRRRRGENLMPWLQQNAPADLPVEVADVQAMSSVLVGAILLSRAGVNDSGPITTQLFAQLGDWPDLLVRFR
ncbi:MAG: TetR family transcriptional regulator [Sphingobium sp.]|nr:TetR family transcriptional regulator [Sphingobium sp.]